MTNKGTIIKQKKHKCQEVNNLLIYYNYSIYNNKTNLNNVNIVMWHAHGFIKCNIIKEGMLAYDIQNEYNIIEEKFCENIP